MLDAIVEAMVVALEENTFAVLSMYFYMNGKTNSKRQLRTKTFSFDTT